ncbi:MAG: hypothetical protein HZB67_04655 [Candidatus Aenigmarchaeota archaeon]|nr:hypothetical protein [Candidatus Aenigmarchaeota archaeon]
MATKTDVKKPKKAYLVELPDTPEYQGRVSQRRYKVVGYSREQALAHVLNMNHCKFLYERFLSDIDNIVKEVPFTAERKQLSLF